MRRKAARRQETDLEVQAKGPNKSQRRERRARVTKDLNTSRVW